MTDKKELPPCPFCGGKMKPWDDTGRAVHVFEDVAKRGGCPRERPAIDDLEAHHIKHTIEREFGRLDNAVKLARLGQAQTEFWLDGFAYAMSDVGHLIHPDDAKYVREAATKRCNEIAAVAAAAKGNDDG